MECKECGSKKIELNPFEDAIVRSVPFLNGQMKEAREEIKALRLEVSFLQNENDQQREVISSLDRRMRKEEW